MEHNRVVDPRLKPLLHPSSSTGIHEACELRDGDKNAYMGKGESRPTEAAWQSLMRARQA